MNPEQKWILLCTAGLIAIMMIFPPYTVVNARHVVIKAGYGFIFDLPPYVSGTSILPASVNIATLLAQIVGVLVVGGLVYFAFKRK